MSRIDGPGAAGTAQRTFDFMMELRGIQRRAGGPFPRAGMIQPLGWGTTQRR